MIRAHEQELLVAAELALQDVPDLKILGTAHPKVPIFSMILGKIHAHDVGTILDLQGVAVRTGHHCAQPLLARFGVPATVRASFSIYNDQEDIKALVQGLRKTLEMFA